MQAVVRGLRCVVATQNSEVGDILFRKNFPAMESVNHSCKPNSKIHDNNVIAIQRIVTGTEITVDFTVHEEMGGGNCLECGAILEGKYTSCLRSMNIV